MTSLIRPSRRLFLFGAASLLAAPAIVRAASIMPVSVPYSDLTAGIFSDFDTEMFGVTIRDRVRQGVRALWHVSRETLAETGGRIPLPKDLPVAWNRRQIASIMERLGPLPGYDREGLVIGNSRCTWPIVAPDRPSAAGQP